MNTASTALVWANCVETLKDRVNSRPFWEALEKTVPVAIENGVLIIGMDASNFNQATHIQQPANHNVVLQVIQERFNAPLQVRVIEGTTPEDWEATKARDAHVAALRQQVPLIRPELGNVPTESWDALYEHLARLYIQTPHRSLAQGKARFANEALYTLLEAMDALYPEEPDEATERALSRALDRIASNAEIPAVVLAFELERLRAWRQSEAEIA